MKKEFLEKDKEISKKKILKQSISYSTPFFIVFLIRQPLKSKLFADYYEGLLE